MNISNVGQNYSITTTASGNKMPTESIAVGKNINQNNSQPTKIDMRNISIDEINTLIKSGESALLDVVPFIPLNVLEQYNNDPEKIGKIKVDLIGQVEKSIDFKKSIGENTDFLSGVLNKFKDLDGKELNGKVDILA